MSKAVTTSLSVTLSGDGFGGSPLLNLVTQNLLGEPPTRIALASGANTIAVPANAAGFVLVPSPQSNGSPNAIVWTVKGISGDTGIAPAPGGWVAYQLTPGALASFVVTAASSGITMAIIWL